MDDRRVLERTHEDLAADVAVIASEFLAGFQKVLEIDRPAVSIFGSARVREDSESYRRWQHRNDPSGHAYYNVTPTQRIVTGVAYIALAALLTGGMSATFVERDI